MATDALHDAVHLARTIVGDPVNPARDIASRRGYRAAYSVYISASADARNAGSEVLRGVGRRTEPELTDSWQSAACVASCTSRRCLIGRAS